MTARPPGAPTIVPPRPDPNSCPRATANVRPSPAPGTRPEQGAPRPLLLRNARSKWPGPRRTADTAWNALDSLPGKPRAPQAGPQTPGRALALQRATLERKQLITVSCPNFPLVPSIILADPAVLSHLGGLLRQSGNPKSITRFRRAGLLPTHSATLKAAPPQKAREQHPSWERQLVRGRVPWTRKVQPVNNGPGFPERRPKAVRQDAPEPAPAHSAPARPRRLTKQTFPRVVSRWNGAQSAAINT